MTTNADREQALQREGRITSAAQKMVRGIDLLLRRECNRAGGGPCQSEPHTILREAREEYLRAIGRTA